MSLTLETAIDRGSDAEGLTSNSPTGAIVGDSATEKLGFYGKTPIAQRSGAAQNTTLVGTASSTAFTTADKAALVEIMNTLVALGVWKGSA